MPASENSLQKTKLKPNERLKMAAFNANNYTVDQLAGTYPGTDDGPRITIKSYLDLPVSYTRSLRGLWELYVFFSSPIH